MFVNACEHKRNRIKSHVFVELRMRYVAKICETKLERTTNPHKSLNIADCHFLRAKEKLPDGLT